MVRVAPPYDIERIKRDLCTAIDRRARQLLDLSHAVHSRPELAFSEHWAAATLAGILEDADFRVQRAAFGLPTAFQATAGPASAGTIVICCEYDALPGIGHGCGHNVIAAASVGAAIALAPLARRLRGHLTLLGTPAEEGGGGKILLAQRGAFSGARAVMLVHPANEDVVTPVLRAAAGYNVVFHGRASHAAMAPEAGRNALDAAILAYNAVGALRATLRSGEQVSMTLCGDGPPNVVPATANARILVRAPTRVGLASVTRRLERCLAAGAAASGCTASLQASGPAYHDLRPSVALAAAFKANAAALGRRLREGTPAEVGRAGSTDLGNVSHIAPTIHPKLAIAPASVAQHTEAFARHAISTRADLAVLDGAKAMAMTAADIWLQPRLRRTLTISR